jgi:Outer membrane protein beta-barrel domain
MKKSLLYFFAFFLVVYQAHAQIQVGPKAGINWNSFRGNKAFDVVPGFNVGGFAKYRVLSFLTAKGEVTYFQQGANLIDYSVIPGDLYHNDATVKFHQIQVPVIAEFGLPSLSEEPLQPKISLGFFYSYNIYSRENYTNVAKVPGYERVEYNGYSNATGQFRRSQYGFVAGIGGDLTIMNMPVSLEFRYTHNIPQISKGDNTTRYNLKNTFEEWGEPLKIGTVSFNVAVTLQTF